MMTMTDAVGIIEAHREDAIVIASQSALRWLGLDGTNPVRGNSEGGA